MKAPIHDDERRLQLVRAWREAERQLGICLTAPYEFVTHSISRTCIAYLPDFGSINGMIIDAAFAPFYDTDERLIEEAAKLGLFVSSINVDTYDVFDKVVYREALSDWGFFGPSERRPSWLSC